MLGDGDGDEAWNGSKESKEEEPCSLLIREDEHLSTPSEIKFTIPKDRYEEVKTAMCNVAIAAIWSLIEIPDCCYGLNPKKQIIIEDR